MSLRVLWWTLLQVVVMFVEDCSQHLVAGLTSFWRQWVVRRASAACGRVLIPRALRFISLTSLLGRLPRRASLVTKSATDHASQDTMKWIAYCARRRHVIKECSHVTWTGTCNKTLLPSTHGALLFRQDCNLFGASGSDITTLSHINRSQCRLSSASDWYVRI